MPIIWTDSLLDSYAQECEKDASSKLDYLFTRFSISTTSGISVYQLPTYVKSILRITWKGYKIWPISWREMNEINPATAVVDESNKYEAPTGRPKFYCLHPTDIRKIRFYPTPNETILADNTKVFSSTGIQDIVALSAWRAADPTGTEWVLPDFVSRRTKKAFILERAFRKEGKGQNLTAASYYREKYNFQLDLLRDISEGIFVSRRPRLEANFSLSGLGRRPGRPILPPNFAKGY